MRALLKTFGPDPAGGQTVAFANNNNPATSINDVPVVNDDLGKIAARLWGQSPTCIRPGVRDMMGSWTSRAWSPS